MDMIGIPSTKQKKDSDSSEIPISSSKEEPELSKPASKRDNEFGAECVWGMDMIGIPSTKQKKESTETMKSLL